MYSWGPQSISLNQDLWMCSVQRHLGRWVSKYLWSQAEHNLGRLSQRFLPDGHGSRMRLSILPGLRLRPLRPLRAPKLLPTTIITAKVVPDKPLPQLSSSFRIGLPGSRSKKKGRASDSSAWQTIIGGQSGVGEPKNKRKSSRITQAQNGMIFFGRGTFHNVIFRSFIQASADEGDR